MAGPAREHILRFYDDLRGRAGLESVEALCVFLPRLFRERRSPVARCSRLTRRSASCGDPTYAEWVNKPAMFILCPAPDRLQIGFEVTLSTEPTYRSVTERVSCSLDRALEEFDRLYAKFLAAHDPGAPRKA